jgi:hypothetical protein
MTIGFWTNKNGQAVLQSHDPAWRTLINGLHLRTASGGSFTVSTTASFSTAFTSFATWMSGANATNMAYMLSAQLAAMELNGAFEGVSANSLLFLGSGSAINSWSNNGQGANLLSNLNSRAQAFGQAGADASGFSAIGKLEADAIFMLSNYGTTTSKGSARIFEEALKIIFDAGNNDLPIFAL